MVTHAATSWSAHPINGTASTAVVWLVTPFSFEVAARSATDRLSLHALAQHTYCVSSPSCRPPNPWVLVLASFERWREEGNYSGLDEPFFLCDHDGMLCEKQTPRGVDPAPRTKKRQAPTTKTKTYQKNRKTHCSAPTRTNHRSFLHCSAHLKRATIIRAA